MDRIADNGRRQGQHDRRHRDPQRPWRADRETVGFGGDVRSWPIMIAEIVGGTMLTARILKPTAIHAGADRQCEMRCVGIVWFNFDQRPRILLI